MKLKLMKRFNLFLILFISCLWSLPLCALTVDGLRVEAMKNPDVIDVSVPRFSWILHSDERGTMQTAYRIVITSDVKGTRIVWDSGTVASDQSVGVPANGVKLLPSRRYYWSVTVTDNKGKKAKSKEKAYFETGLMGSGWSGARWIKAPDAPHTDAVAGTHPADKYTIEADLTLLNGNAGIVFGAVSGGDYCMWQVNTDLEGDYPVIRRYIYINGKPEISNGPYLQLTKADLMNREHHVKISIDGSRVDTYIDNVLADSYTDKDGRIGKGEIGLRVDNNGIIDETAYFDNLTVTEYDKQGRQTITLNETFDGPSDNFYAADIREVGGNRKCYMHSGKGEKRMMQEPMQGAPMFRKAFILGKKVRQAKLYTTALGVYDVFVNGKRVGHLQADGTVLYEELKPGWTDYRKRVFYSSHDVTHLLNKGGNAIGAVVGSGWWQGYISRGVYGYRAPEFMAKLLVIYTDGTTETIVTDGSWAWSKDGALRYSDIYNGEQYDARKESDWTTARYTADGWHAVEAKSEPQIAVEAFKGPYVQALERLKVPAKTTTIYQGVKNAGADYGMINVINKVDGAAGITLKEGQTAVIDFGQNFAGWVVLSVSGNEGTRLHLRFGEMINDDGTLKRGNDGPGGSLYTANLRSARAELYYTLRGEKGYETYSPSTTFYGFRYCEITATAPVTLVSVVGQPVTSSTIDVGNVTTSSDIVNKLVSNIMWGQRSNLLSVPTDCPQRDERLGWTADTQIFSRTGMYNADAENFYRKWLIDMRDGQTDKGGYPDVAPVVWQFNNSNGAWGDAGIVLPWNLYLMYGDKEMLTEHFASMERYMDFLAAQAGDGYKYQGSGTAFGDWLAFAPTDLRYISVAYYAYDALLMAKMARVLSTRAGDEYAMKAKKYEQLFEAIKTEFQNRYFAQGVPSQQSQTAYLLALKFNLCKDAAQRQDVVERLRRLITENNETLSTGFVGTGIISPTLSEFGLNDKAYNLLLQRRCPSWLYSIDQGATTVWERWNSYTVDKGFGPIEMNSFNHYAYGAVGEWLSRFVAGIETDEQQPGFKHIVLQPTPDTRTTLPSGQERITSARASYTSNYGEIVSEWSAENGNTATYNVTVPANTTATLYLPAGTSSVIHEGDIAAERAKGVSFKGFYEGKAVYELGSGSYHFKVSNMILRE